MGESVLLARARDDDVICSANVLGLVSPGCQPTRDQANAKPAMFPLSHHLIAQPATAPCLSKLHRQRARSIDSHIAFVHGNGKSGELSKSLEWGFFFFFCFWLPNTYLR